MNAAMWILVGGLVGWIGFTYMKFNVKRGMLVSIIIGKPAGILTPNEEEAKKFIAWGYTFVAVGADLGLLAKNADALAKRFKPGT